MFNICRRGLSSTNRALGSVSSAIRVPSTRQSALTSTKLTSARLPCEARWLHVSSVLSNQAAAQQEQHHLGFGKEHTRSVTKFQELIDHGMVHRNVVESITRGMGHHTMTEVQSMTINEGLMGTDMYEAYHRLP